MRLSPFELDLPCYPHLQVKREGQNLSIGRDLETRMGVRGFVQMRFELDLEGLIGFSAQTLGRHS